MAVELRISIQENCDSLYVFDETGKYDKTCNPTGWGKIGCNITDATSAELHFYPPGEDSPIIIDVFPNFPTSDGSGYEVLPSDLGLEKFISGVWRFDYHVVKSGETLTSSCQYLLVEDIKCCLETNRVKVNTSNFESKEVIKSNNVFALFESAEINACQGKLKEATKIMNLLYTKCNCGC